MYRRSICLVVALFLSTGFTADSGEPAEPESTRSSPKDTTSYVRPAVPDDYVLWLERDYAYEGQANLLPEVLIVDTVVDNTNPNLTNTDIFNDGETSIAVNPENPNEIVITTFRRRWGANAPWMHSLDGGLTWTEQFAIPVPPERPDAFGCPCDQTIDYGQTDILSGTFLALENVYSGATTDPASAAAWQWFAPGGVTQATNLASNNPDQPWLLVNRDPTNNDQANTYVGYDDFDTAPDMRVAVSSGANPPNFTVDSRSGFSTGFVNPGHRLAKDRHTGFIYSLWQRCIGNCGGDPKIIEYRLNRSTDGGATWPLGGGTGIVVATGCSSQPRPKYGTVNALLGGVTHAAVNPFTGDLYYVYGNNPACTANNNRLAIRRITTDGTGDLVVGAENFVSESTQSAIPSVAVLDSGVVGVFHYTFDGFSSGGFPIFTAHLALSDDQGATFTNIGLLTFLSSAQDNGDPRQRVLGDYMQMKAVKGVNCFFGAFTGNGVPFGRPFANHDPIFFKACFPESADLSIQMTDNPGSVRVGGELTYRLRVRNHGPSNAAGVSVTVSLPANVNFLSASSGCSRSGSTVTCKLGNLSNAESAVRLIRVRATLPGRFSNTATVTANETDPNARNNTDTTVTTVR